MNASNAPQLTLKEHQAKERDPLIDKEIDFVRTRKQDRSADEPLVAVALSGGGVRSGTVCLGFLQALQELRILNVVDYLSSVSGGGYAHGYLLSAANTFAEEGAIFGKAAVDELTAAGRYLATGSGWPSTFRTLRLLGSVLSTTLLNLAWAVSIVALLGGAVSHLFRSGQHMWPHEFPSATASLKGVLWGAGVVLLLRLVSLTLMQVFVLGASFWERSKAAARSTVGGSVALGKILNWFDGVALLIVLGALVLLGLAPEVANWVCSGLEACATFVGWHARFDPASSWPLLTVLAVATGFLISSDVIGVNAVFRNLIDSAYLKAPGRVARKNKLEQLGTPPPVFLHEAARNLRVPYPLFGGGLYLQGECDPRKIRRRVRRDPVGARVMDYFLFSERLCGSLVTGYARTCERPYSRTTIADAIACSAASISPLMGGNSNLATTILLSLFNLNLGVWLPNPKTLTRWGIWHFLRFWPCDYIRMIKRDLNAERALVYVADGGFVDNLGVMELLRRRCSVIVAIDNTWDPEYDFHYLRNLIVRARTEEDLTITFRCNVEDELRPSPVTGFARSDHAIARVTGQDRGTPFHGYLLFIKATLTGPFTQQKPVSQMPGANGNGSGARASVDASDLWAAEYQAYHPHFPQESTADQFFDPAQWHAYFCLGQRVARSAFKDLARQSVTRSSLFAALARASSA